MLRSLASLLSTGAMPAKPAVGIGLHELIDHSSVIGLLGLLAAFENIRIYTLALGIGGIVGGILLFINHKKSLDSVLASDSADRVMEYEMRKYRRRATVSAMVASVGCMLSALYWVNDARVFSVFILMILSLLVGILGVWKHANGTTFRHGFPCR